MPSPFPGMDPYLEGYLWPDVHSALANKIRQQLTPLLRPNYTARLDVFLAQDIDPTGEIGILYPDVEVLEVARRQPPPPPRHQNTSTITPPGLALPVVQPLTVRLTSVEIRDTAQNRLITSIEILSPVNKREPGLTTYRQKRQRLYKAGVHLLELDLLRRGTRPFAQPRLPNVPYCVALTRAQAQQMDLWPLELATPLPVVPVPLQPADQDVPLDLQQALTQIYDEAAYDLSLDYGQPPPPPALTAEDIAWVQAQVKVAKA
ncbi:MAG: DUF4058 family protein [Leptolyngbyaceae cyanobacterium SM2_5_2]|nr:DUF4058 family protein [Leptolyngbyaceae cyanobacterium SM2_5_2]